MTKPKAKQKKSIALTSTERILAALEKLGEAIVSRDDAFDTALKSLIEQILEREKQTRTFLAEIENQLGDQARRIDKLIQVLTESAKRNRLPEGWILLGPGLERDAVFSGKIRGVAVAGDVWADPISLRAWQRSRPNINQPQGE